MRSARLKVFSELTPKINKFTLTRCYCLQIEFFPRAGGNYNSESDSESNAEDSAVGNVSIQKINFQAGQSSNNSNANRYALQFYKESDKQLSKMREDSRKALNYLTGRDLEVDHSYFDGCDFPIRPSWTYEMSKEQLERNENRYFTVGFDFIN